jgi:uncharacterized RDD family membrane protein YckC
VLVSFARKAAPYAPEDGSYRAVAAPLWRRLAASAIDWGLVFVIYLLAGIPLGVIQTVARAVGGVTYDLVFVLTEAAAVGIIAAYFACFFSTGSTLGMRALDIHLFSYRSGREPHLVRAVARSVFALGFFLASINAYGLLRGHHEGGLTAAQETWRAVTVTVALVALAGGLWQLVDQEGRTLWDRFFGLVVVEDIVPASMPDRLWSRWQT